MSSEDKILAILEKHGAMLETMQAEQKQINQRLTKLEQGQTKLEQGQADLTSLVQGIIIHQNNDFALLQVVNEKVDRLANVAQDHDETIRKLRAL